MNAILEGFRYLLMSIALDAHTGDPVSTAQRVNEVSYETVEACEQAAMDRGPIKTKDGVAVMLYCQRVDAT